MNLPTEISHPDQSLLRCYLQGALRDGTYSAKHQSYRFGQAEPGWLRVIASMLDRLGHRSWLYREGKSRNFWVLETTAPFLDPSFRATDVGSTDEGRAFARGYFDADGGIPKRSDARFYIQFTQKDRPDLEALRLFLESDGIKCGALHNPSRLVDPEHWRFYIGACSFQRFIADIGSWHPRKQALLLARAAA